MYIILVAIFATSATALPQLVHRANYGIIFKEIAFLDNAEQKWLHSFHIPLPLGIRRIPPMPACAGDKALCRLHGELMRNIHDMQEDSNRAIWTTLLNIYDLVPEVEKHSVEADRRSRSPFFPFLGELMEKTIGTATEHEVKHVERKLYKIAQNYEHFQNTFEQHNEGLASFMATADERITNAVKGIRNNHDMLLNISQELFESINTYTYLWANISSILIQHVKYAQTIEYQTLQLAMGVQEALQGKLSPFLVPVKILNASLDQISHNLKIYYPDFHLANSHVDYYYNTLNVEIDRVHNILMIRLSIPITSSHEVYKIYEVMSFPVPINESSNHASHLLDHEPYFATAHNHFIEISEFMFRQCKGSDFKHCSLLLGQQRLSKPTCLSSIFYNFNNDVRKLCDFRFIHSGVKEFIFEINPGQLLISNVFDISMDCGKQNQVRNTGCKFCVLNVPCNCKLAAGSFTLPSRISNCNFTKSDINLEYPINLALLQHFFNDTMLKFAQGDTLYSASFNATLPPFKIYEHKFEKTLAQDHKMHLSLKHMSESAKQNETIYRSLSDHFISSIWKPKSTSFLKTHFIEIVFGCLVLYCIITSTLTAWKLYRYAIMINTLAVAKVSAAELPPQNLVWQSPKIQHSTDEPIAGDTIEVYRVWLIVLSTSMFSYFAYKLYKTLVSNCKHSIVYMNVSNGQQCVLIRLTDKAVCSDHLASNLQESHIKISLGRRCLIPVANIEWNSFRIMNSTNEHEIKLPKSIVLNPWVAFRLYKILGTPYNVHILMTHNNSVMQLQTTAPTSNQCMEKTETNTKTDEVPKLPTAPQGIYPLAHLY